MEMRKELLILVPCEGIFSTTYGKASKCKNVTRSNRVRDLHIIPTPNLHSLDREAIKQVEELDSILYLKIKNEFILTLTTQTYKNLNIVWSQPC